MNVIRTCLSCVLHCWHVSRPCLKPCLQASRRRGSLQGDGHRRRQGARWYVHNCGHVWHGCEHIRPVWTTQESVRQFGSSKNTRRSPLTQPLLVCDHLNPMDRLEVEPPDVDKQKLWRNNNASLKNGSPHEVSACTVEQLAVMRALSHEPHADQPFGSSHSGSSLSLLTRGRRVIFCCCAKTFSFGQEGRKSPMVGCK